MMWPPIVVKSTIDAGPVRLEDPRAVESPGPGRDLTRTT
jgi:hypothetical protein